MRISDKQVVFFRQHGYVIVPQFLTSEELADGLKNIARYFPSPEELAASPGRYANLAHKIGFPLGGGGALNLLGTHPELVSFVERVLGTTEIELGDLHLLTTYGALGNTDQELHVDYWGMNSCAYPRDDGPFTQILAFIYYTDVTDDLAPTCVVSQEHTRDELLVPVRRSREEYPHLYELEQKAVVPAGSLVAITMRTFHRGSKMLSPNGVRYMQVTAWHASACRWMQKQNWPTGPGSPDSEAMRTFIEQATPRQRELIGFPAPGHPYWNEEMLRGVSARYPGMDMTPYREAH